MNHKQECMYEHFCWTLSGFFLTLSDVAKHSSCASWWREGDVHAAVRSTGRADPDYETRRLNKANGICVVELRVLNGASVFDVYTCRSTTICNINYGTGTYITINHMD